MAIKSWRQIALSCLIALSCTTAARAHADIFSDYSLDQAKQQAQKDNKLLLIDFTATWCPPCKKMESTTWADADVQEWIKGNAIAIQFDVDRNEKTSSDFDITAMPTVVLFTPQSAGKEFGRQVGYQSAGELLEWLKGAKSGKTAQQIEKEQSHEEDNDTWAHISKAGELQRSQHNAEALDEYIWLWNNISNDSSTFADIRAKMLPVEVKRLCAAYPPAKTKWAEIRDAADKGGKRADWLILNGMLDDNARTLVWFDKAKADPKQHDVIAKNSSWLEPALFGSLRYADAASYLYPQPLMKINEYYKTAQSMLKPRPDTEISKDFDPFPSMVLSVYGAYVGAGRAAEAQKIADECIRLDDTQAMHESLNYMAKAIKTALATQSKAPIKQAK